MATPRIPEGLKAQFFHRRFPARSFAIKFSDIYLADYEQPQSTKKLTESGLSIYSRGGDTRCELRRESDNVIVAVGYSQCNLVDNFNKKIGRAISLGRAIKDYENDGENQREQQQEIERLAA